MDYVKFVKETELISEIYAKKHSWEIEQKEHRKEYFQKMWGVSK